MDVSTDNCQDVEYSELMIPSMDDKKEGYLSNTKIRGGGRLESQRANAQIFIKDLFNNRPFLQTRRREEAAMDIAESSGRGHQCSK
jgi:hypothetical protein